MADSEWFLQLNSKVKKKKYTEALTGSTPLALEHTLFIVLNDTSVAADNLLQVCFNTFYVPAFKGPSCNILRDLVA